MHSLLSFDVAKTIIADHHQAARSRPSARRDPRSKALDGIAHKEDRADAQRRRVQESLVRLARD